MTSQWSGGFQGDVTIENTGTDPIDGWALEWSFTGGQQISQAWNASIAQTGTAVVATNASWNVGIAAGAGASFGFIATTGTAGNPVPASFVLNGVGCAAG